jgi:molecular chaperone HscB
MSTAFEVLGLERAFALDPSVLENKLIEASLQWHPDRFALAPEADRLAAEDHMAAINEAHDALVDPLNRAEILLTVANAGLADAGQNPNQHADRNADPMFLMEMMELREEVEAAIQKGGETVLQMHQQLNAKEADVLQQFGKQWHQAPPTSGSTSLAELQKLYEHARYLRSSRRQLEQAMHAQL